MLLVVLFTSLFVTAKFSTAQQYQNGKLGINIGVVFALGTHIDRFGVTVNSYYLSNHFQLNPELRLYFNAKNLGPNKSSIEAVIGLGLVYAYGKNDTLINEFYSPISNQTQRKNSISYAYRFYLNNIKTNQKTGAIAIEINKFSLIAENDLFAQPKLDRYRTGAFLLQYRKNKFQFAVNATLFTGQMGERITDKNYPFNHVYENEIGGKYTNVSNGLLSGQILYAGDYHQFYQANIGVDAERVRHAIQNRFIHDMLVLPKLTGNINAHIPMIDDKGKQYLFKEEQKVKPIKFYMNLFSNPAIFY